VEQELPAALHAESAILGCMLLDETAINDALEHLVADDFLLDSHRKVFTSICELSETGNAVDYITVMNDLQRRKELDSVGGPAWLASLSEDVPRKMNIMGYCKIVKDKAILRSVMVLSQTMMARAADQSEESKAILEDAEERILELSQQSQTRGFSTMMDALKDAGGLDAYVDAVCDPVAMSGLPMGFTDIDAMTGGMKPGDLIVVAGRPGSGKSSHAINVATNVVRDKADAVVAIFSLEMTKESLQNRMVSSVGGVSIRRMQQGFVGKQERSQIAGAARWLAEKRIHIDDSPSMTPLQMRSKCRRLKQRMGKLDLIIIDYLQILSPGKKFGNREQEVASFSRSSKALAKELEVPVIALAQLSRAGETQGDKRPMLSSLRESGSIEADADWVCFIHRQELFEPDNEDVKGVAEFIISKQRGGPTGVVKLAYIADLTKFDNLVIQRGGSNAY
jgi:replicative DNA helicase